MKKIFRSLVLVLAIAAAAGFATYSFFSDEETSTGNTFTAGAIDLKIDNKSYATDFTIPGFQNPTGAIVASSANTWQLNDLTNQLFFNFVDLKPGDIGEDTISVHVNNNDAYACMNIKLTDTPENDANEAEVTAGDSASSTTGELQNELNFAFWNDDGDNVYEEGETIFSQGLAKDLFDGKYLALADSQKNVWSPNAPAPIKGAKDYYIGKIWCFGTLTPNAVAAGQGVDPTKATGFNCSGATVDNKSQTDGIKADVSFYAVQSRNNSGFTCSSLNVCDYSVVTTGDPRPGLYGSTVTPVTITNTDCSQINAMKVVSPTQNFNNACGWAGMSCVENGYKNAVGGGVLGDSSKVCAQGLAEYDAPSVGGFNYPDYPHYDFNGNVNSPGGEEGYVVSANTGVTNVVVYCAQ